MATTKLSLTLDSDLVAQARRQVGERGLSSYVSDALRIRLQRDRILALLAEAEERAGPVPQEMQEAADRLFGLR